MYFVIDHPELKCHIDIPDKIAIVSGPSGEGKTYAAEVYQRIQRLALHQCADCPYTVVVPNATTIDTVSSSTLIDGRPVLFMLDEALANKYLDTLIKLPCYLFVVTRKGWNNVAHSYRSRFVAVRDNTGRTVIQPIMPSYRLPEHLQYNTILVEDSASGYDCYRSWFGDRVISCKGNTKIASRLTGKLFGPHVHIFADGGGLGGPLDYLQERVTALESMGYYVHLWLPECFEEILLGADFIPFESEVLTTYDICYPTTENYCEELLKKYTAGTHYEYDHDKGGFLREVDPETHEVIQSCWLRECVPNCGTCKDKVDADKKYAILHKGSYPQLLQLQVTPRVPFFRSCLREAVSCCIEHPNAWVSIPSPKRLPIKHGKYQTIRCRDVSLLVKTHGAKLWLSLVQDQQGHTYIPDDTSYQLVTQVLANCNDVSSLV